MGLVTGLAGGSVQAVERLATAWVSVQPGDYDPSSGRGPEWGKAAPAGLLIWLFMGVALFFLIKSMNRHIKRVPKTFDEDATAAESPTPRDDVEADSDPGESESSMTLSSAAVDSGDEKRD